VALAVRSESMARVIVLSIGGLHLLNS